MSIPKPFQTMCIACAFWVCLFALGRIRAFLRDVSVCLGDVSVCLGDLGDVSVCFRDMPARLRDVYSALCGRVIGGRVSALCGRVSALCGRVSVFCGCVSVFGETYQRALWTCQCVCGDFGETCQRHVLTVSVCKFSKLLFFFCGIVLFFTFAHFCLLLCFSCLTPLYGRVADTSAFKVLISLLLSAEYLLLSAGISVLKFWDDCFKSSG